VEKQSLSDQMELSV